MNPYIVYVKLNDAKYIIAVNSSAFLTNIDGWTEIDSGYGDRYHHAQGNYFPKPIIDKHGVWRYKLEDDAIIERTQEEMDADYIEPETQPTQEDRITALESKLDAFESAYTIGVNEA